MGEDTCANDIDVVDCSETDLDDNGSNDIVVPHIDGSSHVHESGIVVSSSIVSIQIQARAGLALLTLPRRSFPC